MNDVFEVLSALLDGEDVDIERLMGVLATADGRDALADFLRTRQVVRADDADPHPEFVARLRSSLVPRRPGLVRPALAAAAVLVLAFLGGWWMGVHRDAARAPGAASPPAVTRTLTFERNVDWHDVP
jgi:hypothetical protein